MEQLATEVEGCVSVLKKDGMNSGERRAVFEDIQTCADLFKAHMVERRANAYACADSVLAVVD